MSYGDKKGNALKDGYSCYGCRPRSAAPGVIMDEEGAARFDEHSDMIRHYGGRDAALRRRFEDRPQNTVPPDDEYDNGPWW